MRRVIHVRLGKAPEIPVVVGHEIVHALHLVARRAMLHISQTVDLPADSAGEGHIRPADFLVLFVVQQI